MGTEVTPVNTHQAMSSAVITAHAHVAAKRFPEAMADTSTQAAMTAGIARPNSWTSEPHTPGAHRLPAGQPSSQLNVAVINASPRNASAVPRLATSATSAATHGQRASRRECSATKPEARTAAAAARIRSESANGGNWCSRKASRVV